MLKCKSCGAELIAENGIYICPFCQQKYSGDELFSTVSNDLDFIIKNRCLIEYKGNNQIVKIPEGVVSIGNSAFKNNTYINCVIFSSSVDSIGNNSFENCINLKEINNYKNIANYGIDAFRNSNLKTITIGNNVLYLGKGCFSNINGLLEVNYEPNKDLKLNSLFYGCHNLSGVKMNRKYFYPAFHKSLEIKKRLDDQRPTFSDAFIETSYIKKIRSEYLQLLKEKICPDCGGKISKFLFFTKCKQCKMNYTNKFR